MSEVLPELKETEKSDCGDVNNFKVPEKCVKSAQDIPIWEKSDAYQVKKNTPKPNWQL